MKLKLFLALIVLVIFTAGCIDNSQSNAQEKYNLQYGLKMGDTYNYDVLATIEKPNIEVSEATSIYVTGVGNNYTNLKIFINSKINDVLSEETYYLNMTSKGTIVNVSSDNLIIPEIQPELVSILEYPEKEITQGKIWHSYFNKNDSYFTNNNLVEYTIVGNTTYKYIGTDEISVSAGKFDCAVVVTDTNYILEMSSTSKNKTVSLKTIGNTQGENWVDLNKGFLVKSEYYIDKNTITNYSDAYKEIGIENAYRETPMNSYVTSELLSIKGD